MKKKITLAKIASAGNKVASDAGDLAQDVFKNTRGLVIDISKSFSKIRWEGMYKDSRKSFKVAVKKGNKIFNRTMKDFRRSNFYDAVNNYMVLVRKWSKVQIKSINKLSTTYYSQTRKWVNRAAPKVRAWAVSSSSNAQTWMGSQYPKVKNFVRNNYPIIQGVQGFVMTQLPVYRAAFK